MAIPLISVVIPTCGRPMFLPEAVRSALEAMEDDVEVIVVPNGPDDSWKQSMASFELDHRVRIEPIAKAHANAARNHGLALARGKYVRFLDDDDFLYPGATSHQCSLLNDTQTDICSGSVDLVTEKGAIFGAREVPDTSDFVESILAPEHVSLPTAHVFRRSAINGLQWDETVSLAQDKHWMYQLCERGDWKWIRTDQRVGVWRQHVGHRISGNIRKRGHAKVWANMLFRTIEVLNMQNRLDASRKDAASKSLWRIICAHYFLKPIYWDGVLRRIQLLFPNTYPAIFFYNSAYGQLIPPRAILIGTIPLLAARRQIRLGLQRLGLRTYAIPP